ncbi:hypothetical protein P4305_18750 [Bacillus thuringiensis]|nr:hypothetical protein [Bacillus thuringiensis]
MIVHLFEPKAKPLPLQYGDIVEITFKDDALHDNGVGYYILTYNDTLINMGGSVRYNDKCRNIDEVIKELNHDANIDSWRVLSKDDYTVQIHKNTK